MEAPVGGLQDPYLTTLFISINEYLKLYNTVFLWLPGSCMYDLNRSNGLDFTKNWRMMYPHLDSKQNVFIVTARDAHNLPTEIKGIILFYPSITQVMVESHYEILWLTTLEQIWGATPQQIMQQDYMTHQISK